MTYSEAGARFSADRRYRYSLRRVWYAVRPPCNFVMLNPSTADETIDDPTIARCARRSFGWGYGGLVVTNLFARCATDPRRLRREGDPVGRENDAAIREAARGAGLVVCAWGNHGAYLGRASVVCALIDELGVARHCLGRTRAGEPAHPLYLGYDRTPVPMADATVPSSRPGAARLILPK